ncbi:GMP synthase-like glutamine amidotransferase [Nocardia sp. GAS34]|uniref:glutamine amidotransferase-related protein n=1 Tax=unclassified Nocardia TaxID=2637762 RepID=UPI003D250D56
MVDVLICVADGFIYDSLDYGLRIQERFATEGFDVRRADLTTANTDELPLAQVYVFTGGETSVNSGSLWMSRAVGHAERLVRTADATTHRVIGICLGSQIIAEALRPGSIVSLPAIDIGLIRATRHDEDDAEETIPTFHYETISPELGFAEGVRLTWSSATTSVEGFSYGSAVHAYQFHPELTSADLRRLIHHRSTEIEGRNGSPIGSLQSVDRYSDSLSPDLFRRLIVNRCGIENTAPRAGVPSREFHRNAL